MELEKAAYWKDEHIDDWKNYFVLPDFYYGLQKDTFYKYTAIYNSIDFSKYIEEIPEYIKYSIVLNAGVGGNYNEQKKIIYISVNTNENIDNFLDHIIHEYCHIRYNRLLADAPTDLLEEAIEIIAWKKYGRKSIDHTKYDLVNKLDYDNLYNSIIKIQSKYNSSGECRKNVFTTI